MSATSGGELFQNSVYVGINLQDILYGIELVLYFKTMHTLLTHKGERTKSDVFYAIFSSVMLLMTTIWVSARAIFGEKMWLLDAGFPGGPNAFWAANISVWYMDLATMALVVLQLMMDALMIYHCWAVWNSYCVIILPSILWAGTFVLGILVGWSSSASGRLFFRDIAVQLSLAYYGVSVFLTAILTWMICYRMVLYGRMIKERLGHEYASPYFATVALVLESVLPHTLSGIAFLVSLGLGSQILTLFGYVHPLLMCVSTQMLIPRVAMGRAWMKNTGKQLPLTLKFSPQEDMTSGSVSKSSEVLYVETLGSTQKGDDNMV